jgi:hypothetical protein
LICRFSFLSICLLSSFNFFWFDFTLVLLIFISSFLESSFYFLLRFFISTCLNNPFYFRLVLCIPQLFLYPLAKSSSCPPLSSPTSFTTITSSPGPPSSESLSLSLVPY